jgi:hypothetical protein
LVKEHHPEPEQRERHTPQMKPWRLQKRPNFAVAAAMPGRHDNAAARARHCESADRRGRLAYDGVMAKKPPPRVPAEKLELYDKLVESVRGVERKGATMPYTSVNGHMTSFLTPEGALALRLPEPERSAMIAKWKTKLCEQHGTVLKEYVVVPDAALRKTADMRRHFQKSVDYVAGLPPKATKRKP